MHAAERINSLPGVIQGFTTRRGGIGEAPYDTLNLSYTCGDRAQVVAENRKRVAAALGFSLDRWAMCEQVHGCDIKVIRKFPSACEPIPRADALVTDVPGVLLALQFADCYPVYLIDPTKRVIALLHCGWRGASGNIVRAATDTLVNTFGVEPRSCYAAIGPGISGANYEVGEDVAAVFQSGYDTSPQPVVGWRAGTVAKWNLHVQRAIYSQLLDCGYAAEFIALSDSDTYSRADEFFSHRRESQKGLITGRMIGYFGLIE